MTPFLAAHKNQPISEQVIDAIIREILMILKVIEVLYTNLFNDFRMAYDVFRRPELKKSRNSDLHSVE